MNFKDKHITEYKSDDFLHLGIDELLSDELIEELYSLDDSERDRVKVRICVAAKELGVRKEIEQMFKSYDKELKENQSNQTKFSSEGYSSLNCGNWIADDEGVRIWQGEQLRWACKTPIQPIALLDNIGTGSQKITLQFGKGEHIKTVTVDKEVVYNHSKITQLANKGVEVTSENAKYLVRYISEVLNSNPVLVELITKKSVSQLGWCKYGFVPYAENIEFDGEETNKQIFNAINSKGSFEEWQQLTRKVRKQLPIRLAMAASFGSVLIEKIGGLPFVLHIWGGSGTGKTVTLRIATSIWGYSEKGGLLQTLNMTENAMLSTAAFLKNLPFIGDELQTIKSRYDNFDTIIMTLCDGLDRGRMNYNTKEAQNSWKCAILTTGEEPITKSNSAAGVKNRVIEIEVENNLFEDKELIEVLEVVDNHYGHAGRKYIEYIERIGTDKLNNMFSDLKSEISSKTTGKQASTWAVLLLADKLARECFYPDEQPLTVDELEPYLLSSEEISVSDRAYNYLVNYIIANKYHFSKPGSLDKVEIFGAWKEKNNEVCIFIEYLYEALKAQGYTYDSVKKDWAAKGYITKIGKSFSGKVSVFGNSGTGIKFNMPLVVDDTDYEEIPFG